MNEYNLLAPDWIGRNTDWTQKDNAEAFLKAFVAKIEPYVQVEVTNEKFFSNDLYTLHLSIGNKKISIPVSLEELVNCNSPGLSAAEESQKELAEKVRRALGEIMRQQRKLGFVK